MTQVVRAALTDQPISLAEHQELVSHQAAGAVVGFVGMIRNHDNGRQVVKPGVFRSPVGRRCHRRSSGRNRRAVPRDTGHRGQPPDRRPADRRGGAGSRGRRRPSPSGICHLRTVGGRDQSAVAGVETPSLRRRNRRMGGLDLAIAIYPPANGGRTSIVLPACSGWAWWRTAKPSHRKEHRTKHAGEFLAASHPECRPARRPWRPNARSAARNRILRQHGPPRNTAR